MISTMLIHNYMTPVMHADYNGYFIVSLAIVGTLILAVAAVYITYLLTQEVSDALPTLRDVSKKIDNEEKRVNNNINKHDLGMTIAASVLASRTVKDDYNVYILFDKSTENPLYVGITNSPARRLPEHGRDLRFSSYILEMKVSQRVRITILQDN